MAFLHSDVPSDGHSGHSTGNLQSGGPPSLFLPSDLCQTFALSPQKERLIAGYSTDR